VFRLFGLLGGRRGKGNVRDERRAAYRYRAAANDARLGWWAGDDFREAPARFGDVSQSGASVVSAELPPAVELYLRLSRPAQTDWAAVSVLWVEADTGGCYRLRVVFPGGCPYEVFNGARGHTPDERVEAVSPEFDGRYWY
jgi:hypothetical protein